MPNVDAKSRARAAVRRGLGARVLAALVTGASVEAIAENEGVAVKRVEKLLRDELQRRWLAPAQEHARLQIARLESIYAKLKPLAGGGDFRAIDQILRVLDRLDRYHGFEKLAPANAAQGEDARQKLIAKLSKGATQASRVEASE